MRREKFWIATDDIPWEPTSIPLVKRKLLNGSLKSDQSTMLVNSKARPANHRRAQFHTADEEFFIRGGNFTFDGLMDLKARAYVFYPRGCIHGANVHISGGYEMLLRYDGQQSLQWVDDPENDFAYFADDQPGAAAIVEIGAVARPALTNGEVAISTLRQRDATRNAATLVDGHFSPAMTMQLSGAGWLECFVIQADKHISDGAHIKPGSYRFIESASNTLEIAGEGLFSMVVFHEKKLEFTTL